MGILAQGYAGSSVRWRLPSLTLTGITQSPAPMAASLVVPSDITILENKLSIGKQKLGYLETFGLLGMSPMFHLTYSKMDPADMRAVLAKKYDEEDMGPQANIVKTRQEAVRKQAVAHNFLWGGSGTMAGLVWWSFRRYNYQSRLVALPFVFYGGTFVGRVVGDVVTGRNAEFARDRFLASLPAKVYYDA